MADTFVCEIHKVRKGLWAFFLDCAFRMLIGWAGRSRDSEAGWDDRQESDAEMAVVGKAEVRIE